MTELSPRARDMLAAGRSALTPHADTAQRVHAALLANIEAGAPPPSDIRPVMAERPIGGLIATGLIITALVVTGIWLIDRRTPDPPAITPTPVAVADTEPGSDSDSASGAASSSASNSASGFDSGSTSASDSASGSDTDSASASTSDTDTGSASASPSRSAPAPRPRRKLPRSAPEPPGLAEELRRLRKARAHLRAGEGTQALATLTAYFDQFPRGVLRQEAHSVRVDVLCSLGLVDEARADADRFVARWPDSPIAHRMQSACKQTTDNPTPQQGTSR